MLSIYTRSVKCCFRCISYVAFGSNFLIYNICWVMSMERALAMIGTICKFIQPKQMKPLNVTNHIIVDSLNVSSHTFPIPVNYLISNAPPSIAIIVWHEHCWWFCALVLYYLLAQSTSVVCKAIIWHLFRNQRVCLLVCTTRIEFCRSVCVTWKLCGIAAKWSSRHSSIEMSTEAIRFQCIRQMRHSLRNIRGYLCYDGLYIWSWQLKWRWSISFVSKIRRDARTVAWNMVDV